MRRFRFEAFEIFGEDDIRGMPVGGRRKCTITASLDEFTRTFVDIEVSNPGILQDVQQRDGSD
jgi:hypothetical protein